MDNAEVEAKDEEGFPAVKPPKKIKGEDRISLGISSMGGSGSLSSAIILAMSSLLTWRDRLSRLTEDGLVVTRIGVRGLRVGLGGTPRLP